MLEPVKFYESEKDLKFYLIDCDSGLMHLIIFPDDTVMLFDCNVTEDNGDKILLFLSKVIPEKDEKQEIDIFVNSHRDQDHLRGLKEINATYKIKSIWDSGQSGANIDNSDYKYYMYLKRKLKRHISYLPRDRKENGIVKDMNIEENLTLSVMKDLKKAGIFLDHAKSREIVEEYVRKINIKLEKIEDNITSLSGGNQQKVILARTLSSNPELIILDNPTQGVDVGAKLEIYKLIQTLAAEGMSFLVLSGEAQEVLFLCDRIYVMFHGDVKAELDRKEASEEMIMIAATGGEVKRKEESL